MDHQLTRQKCLECVQEHVFCWVETLFGCHEVTEQPYSFNRSPCKWAPWSTDQRHREKYVPAVSNAWTEGISQAAWLLFLFFNTHWSSSNFSPSSSLPPFPFFYCFGLNLGRGEVSCRDLDLGRQDFLPWLSAWGDVDQFPILCSAGHWAMVCVDQEIPSCFVAHNTFISATEPKLLFCFSFFFDETVRTLFL